MSLLHTLRNRAKNGFDVRALNFNVSIRVARAHDMRPTAIGKVLVNDLAFSRARIDGLALSLDPARLSIPDQMIVRDLYRTCIGVTDDAAREVLLRGALFRSYWAASDNELKGHIAEQIAHSFRRSGAPEESIRIVREAPASPRLQRLEHEIDEELDLAAAAFQDHVIMPDRVVDGRHAFLRDVITSSPELFRGRAVLHIAPEREVRQFLARNATQMNMQYVTLDAFSPNAAIKDDVRRLETSDASFDTILCHHVLEHVLDDSAAIRELRRILRRDGILHVSVPQNGRLARSIEWGIPDVNATDHVRMYGADFRDRLRAAGFTDAGYVYTEPCYLKAGRTWRRPYYICRAT